MIVSRNNYLSIDQRWWCFTGKKKGKKKYIPVALDSILPNAVVRTTSSWAEEVENDPQLSGEYPVLNIWEKL